MGVKLAASGSTYEGYFLTSDGTSLVAADSTPTATVLRNSTVDGSATVTITATSVTGLYFYAVTIPAYTVGNTLAVYINWTVNGLFGCYIDAVQITTNADVVTPANSSITAIKAQTDKIPASPAAVGSAMTLDLTQALTLTSASTVGGALSGALNRFLKQVVVGVPGTAGSRLNIYKTDGTTLLASIDLSTANTAAPL